MDKEAKGAFRSEVEIWLANPAGKDSWTISAVRLRMGSFSQAVECGAFTPPDEILADDVAMVLQRHLSRKGTPTRLEMPEVTVQLKGLTLTGLMMEIRADSVGNLTCCARFNEAHGHLPALLRSGLSTAPGVELQIEDVALPAMQELLIPAIEVFDHIMENGLSEQDADVLRARLKTLKSRRDELSDLVSLLTRCCDYGVERKVEANSANGISTTEWSASEGLERSGAKATLWGHHDHTRLSA